MSLNLIPPKAAVGAQRLLMAYLYTNTPAALSRALPRRKTLSAPFCIHNEGDSTVAKRAACIAQCRDCWEMLHDDFLLRQSAVPPPPKGKTRRHSERIGHDKLDVNDSDTFPSVVVAEDAWPLLEWLVLLFERDEELSETYMDGADLWVQAHVERLTRT